MRNFAGEKEGKGVCCDKIAVHSCEEDSFSGENLSCEQDI